MGAKATNKQMVIEMGKRQLVDVMVAEGTVEEWKVGDKKLILWVFNPYQRRCWKTNTTYNNENTKLEL